MKFRKKPVVVEAWELTPLWIRQHHTVDLSRFKPVPLENGEVLMTDSYHYEVNKQIYFIVYGDHVDVFIRTLEGDHKANVGDMIITGVKDEVYPCKPDIFELTYEPVGENTKSQRIAAMEECLELIPKNETHDYTASGSLREIGYEDRIYNEVKEEIRSAIREKIAEEKKTNEI